MIGIEVELPVVLKSKPLDSDIAALMTSEQASEAEITEMQGIVTVSSLRLVRCSRHVPDKFCNTSSI